MHLTEFLQSTSLAAAAAVAATPALSGGFAEPVATPVVAPVVAPPAPVVQTGDWAGGYIGLEVSGAELGYDIDIEGVDDGDLPSADGSAFGVTAGYRFDFGRIVLGGEVAYTRIGFDFDDLAEGLGDVEGDLIRTGVQVGYDAGRILPYLTAGYVNLSDDDADVDGDYIGIGVDYAVSSRITVGAQYLRHNFDDLEGIDGLGIDIDTLGLRAAYNF